MNTQNEFLQTHAPDGVLTPEQAAQFLELAQGDTGTTPETVDAPASSTAPEAATTEGEQGTTNEPSAADTAASQEPDPATAVVMAKDGKHTIPYEKLVEAREGEKHWKAQADAAAAELATLKEQAQQRAEAGEAATETDKNAAAAQAAIDAGVNPEIFGDFSEAELAKGIQTLIDQKVAAQVDARVKQALETTLKPIQEKQQLDANQAHYQAIYDAHPDADSIAESKELNDWLNTQPSIARSAYEQALAKGSAVQVIEVFDTFKKATGAVQQAPAATDPKADPKAAARAAIEKVGNPVPNSLTDIPGGAAGKSDPMEAMAEMSPTDLLAKFENMTPAQIERLL